MSDLPSIDRRALLPPFDYEGSAVLVPTIPWVRDAAFSLPEVVEEIQHNKDLTMEFIQKVRDFARSTPFLAQAIPTEIDPAAKQAALLFDDVFYVSEYPVNEPTTIAPFDPENEALKPRLKREDKIPDVIHIPQHLTIGFASLILSRFDNSDRRLRMPGWSAARNNEHLKNVNQGFQELMYIDGMTSPRATFSLLIPERFQRVVAKKSEAKSMLFSGSPSAQLLFPNLSDVPWDELRDIAKEKDCFELRKQMREWDAYIATGERQYWTEIGRLLQPVLNSLIDELRKSRVTKTEAWMKLLAGFLPTPIGETLAAMEIVKAYVDKSIVPAVTKVKSATARDRT